MVGCELVDKRGNGFAGLIRQNMVEIIREAARTMPHEQIVQPSFNHGTFFFLQIYAIVGFYVGGQLTEFLISH